MIRNFLKNVRAWNIVAGVPLKDRPLCAEQTQKHLMLKLLQEECAEYQAAMMKKNVTEVADALGDIIVICASTAAQYGIDLAPVVEEIMYSNWTKFKIVKEPAKNLWTHLAYLKTLNPDVHSIRYTEGTLYEVVLREDEKIVKHPETYQKPRLKPLLAGYPEGHLDNYFRTRAELFFNRQGLSVADNLIESLAKELRDTAGY